MSAPVLVSTDSVQQYWEQDADLLTVTSNDLGGLSNPPRMFFEAHLDGFPPALGRDPYLKVLAYRSGLDPSTIGTRHGGLGGYTEAGLSFTWPFDLGGVVTENGDLYTFAGTFALIHRAFQITSRVEGNAGGDGTPFTDFTGVMRVWRGWTVLLSDIPPVPPPVVTSVLAVGAHSGAYVI